MFQNTLFNGNKQVKEYPFKMNNKAKEKGGWGHWGYNRRDRGSFKREVGRVTWSRVHNNLYRSRQIKPVLKIISLVIITVS